MGDRPLGITTLSIACIVGGLVWWPMAGYASISPLRLGDVIPGVLRTIVAVSVGYGFWHLKRWSYWIFMIGMGAAVATSILDLKIVEASVLATVASYVWIKRECFETPSPN